MFLTVPVFAALASIAMLSIPASAIDEDRARGLDAGEPGDVDVPKGTQAPSGYLTLLRSWLRKVFALCAMLFHFANAPLLPLVGQKLAQSHPAWATAMMSGRD